MTKYNYNNIETQETWQHFAAIMLSMYEEGDYKVVWENDTYKIIYFNNLPAFASLFTNIANYYALNKITDKLEWGVSSYEQLERMIDSYFDKEKQVENDVPSYVIN